MIPEISAAFATIKTLKDLAAGSDNHKFLATINDLHESLMTAREKIMELQEDNITLNAKTKELQAKRTTRDDIEFREFAVFKKSTNEGPFCSACWDDKKKQVSLHKVNRHYYDCPVCKGVFCPNRETAKRAEYQAIEVANKASGGLKY